MFGICAQKGSSTSTTALAQPSPSGWQATAGILKSAVAEGSWLAGPMAVARQARLIPRGTAKDAAVVEWPAGTVPLATTVPLPCVTTSKRYCAWPESKPWAFWTVKTGVSVVTCAPSIGLIGTGTGPRGGPGELGVPPESDPQQAVSAATRRR